MYYPKNNNKARKCPHCGKPVVRRRRTAGSTNIQKKK